MFVKILIAILLLYCSDAVFAFIPPHDEALSGYKLIPFYENVTADYYDLQAQNISNGAANRNRRSGSATSTHSCHWVRSVPSKVRSELRLSSFYTRYTEAYGIPVLSSPNVPDAALQRACYITRFLFADLYKARNSFYSYFGRTAVIGRNVRTTQLPEYSSLPRWWDQRARGFGATPSRPVSCVEEENLLCESGDKWYNEDIGIHEFSHGLQILGMVYSGSTFTTKLSSIYRSAIAKGLWANTYAATDMREYWAEGVTTYFNVQAYSPKPDGIHNSINTREKLAKYDSQLYSLIKRTFPCNNYYIKRCTDKNQAKSLRQRLRINYPKCTLEAEEKGVKVATSGPSSECVDKNKNCHYWATQNYCTSAKYKGFMVVNCCKSCKR